MRIAGQGKAASETTLTPNAGLVPVPGQEARPDLREERYRIVGGAELTIVTPAGRQRLTVDAIPDRPPEVTAVGGPEVNGRGTFNLTYRAKDDYGLSSAEAVIEPLKSARALVPVPHINLALPGTPTASPTPRPWSTSPTAHGPERGSAITSSSRTRPVRKVGRRMPRSSCRRARSASRWRGRSPRNVAAS